MASFKEIASKKLTKDELKLFKRSQDIIGDIAIIEVPEELEKKAKVLAELLLESKPYVKTVLRKGKHSGEFRIQKLKWLAGEKKKETIHTETRTRIKLDVEKVYFSPRLSTERERISQLVNIGEEILVMFSGCAPFPCVIGKNSLYGRIVGIEVNPTAHKYGLENIKLNKLNKVELICGDVSKVIPKLTEQFDRVLMPAPHNANEFLELAFKVVRPKGIVHYYDFADNLEDAKKIVKDFAKQHSHKIRVTKAVKCGEVGVRRYRVCVDFKVLSI